MKLLRNFFLVFVAFLSLAAVTTFVNAQTNAETVKNTAQTTVEYPLPYPGVLPDNVLYPLKALRDRVMEYLTIDPLKKAEFYLLQADKRLASAQALFEKGNFVLAEQAVSKGEKYFLTAFDQVKLAKEKGKDTRDIHDRLKRASAKHKEVINLLLSRAPQPIKNGLRSSQELLKGIEDTFFLPVSATNSGQPAPSE